MALFKIVSVCKGGGYRYARTIPVHPRANSKGLYPLHRVLMENKLGRLLEPGEIVHHKDEIRSNDTIKNLELKRNNEHARDHAIERAPPSIPLVCAVCSKRFELKPYFYRARLKQSKGNGLACSRACGTRLGFRSRGIAE